MKTIYIEIDEEITSVIDRIRKITDREIVLVIPQRALLLQSIVNLKLLKGQGDILGRRVIIVTADQLGRHLAVRAGLEVREKVGNRAVLTTEIEVSREEKQRETKMRSRKQMQPFSSLERQSAVSVSDIVRRAKSQKFYPLRQEKDKEKKKFFSKFKVRRAKGGRPDRPAYAKASADRPKYPGLKRKHSRRLGARLSSFSAKIGLGFIGLSLVLVVLIILLVLPHATVTIIPKSEPLSQNVELVVRTGLEEIDDLTKAIPGEFMILEKQESRIFSSTGKQEILEKAVGTLTIYNEKGVSQTLVATTRLMAEGEILFRTKERVVIPPASVSPEGSLVPGAAAVSVIADQAGPEGNIAPCKFYVVAFSESQRQKVYARSTEVFTGGASYEANVVAEKDLEEAQRIISEDLITIGREEIKAELDLNLELPEGAIESEIIEEEASRGVGEQAESFEQKVKVRLKALVFSSEEAAELALHSTIDLLPDDKYIINPSLEEGIGFSIASIDLTQERALLNVRVEKQVAWKIDTLKLKAEITGLSQEEALEHLNEVDEILEAELKLWPFWVRKVPSLEKKVEIEIKAE